MSAIRHATALERYCALPSTPEPHMNAKERATHLAHALLGPLNVKLEHVAAIERHLEEYRREGMEAMRQACAATVMARETLCFNPHTTAKAVLATPLPGEDDAPK